MILLLIYIYIYIYNSPSGPIAQASPAAPPGGARDDCDCDRSGQVGDGFLFLDAGLAGRRDDS